MLLEPPGSGPLGEVGDGALTALTAAWLHTAQHRGHQPAVDRDGHGDIDRANRRIESPFQIAFAAGTSIRAAATALRTKSFTEILRVRLRSRPPQVQQRVDPAVGGHVEVRHGRFALGQPTRDGLAHPVSGTSVEPVAGAALIAATGEGVRAGCGAADAVQQPAAGPGRGARSVRLGRCRQDPRSIRARARASAPTG